jgi:hypothetical protein
MIHFRHRLISTEEISIIKQYFLTHGDAPWKLSSFSDQFANKFYQQLIDKENHNASSTNHPDTITVEVKQNNSNLSFYEPSDLFAKNV